jgi:hypothetical protein
MTTFVLIHGAGDAAWSWHLLAAELQARHHDVVAVDLPCDDDRAGLAEYADTVVDAIGDRRDLVVVGHSLGAFTAPLVCARVAADRLVLLAPMIPAPGEPFGDWWANTGHAPVDPDMDETAMFFHDVPPSLAAEAMRHERDQSETPLGTPWPLEAWPEVPTSVLICRDDRVFPAPFSRRVAQERLGITPDEIDGGHCIALSRPGALADQLHAYATGGRAGSGDAAMTTPYTCKQLTDVKDSAPGFGLGDYQQVRFATAELDAETTGFAHLRINANTRSPFAGVSGLVGRLT